MSDFAFVFTRGVFLNNFGWLLLSAKTATGRGKNLCWILLFNKVEGLQVCNCIKKRLQVFSSEYCGISKNTDFKEHLWTTRIYLFNPFHANVPFFISSWKHQNTVGFVMIHGGMKKKHLPEMGFTTVIEIAQKMKFSIKDFFSKCDQIRWKLRNSSYLLKKS